MTKKPFYVFWKIFKHFLFIFLPITLSSYCLGQTNDDAFMMNKSQICLGGMFTYSSFDHYWEGTFKRNNLNLGTVTSRNYSFMGIYGITRNINFLWSIPYITTHSSAGTLHGMSGFQDLSLMLKFHAVNLKGSFGKIDLFGIGGITFPTNAYLADYLPLSIGVRSRTVPIRVLVDYQFRKIFFTGSYFYSFRENITLDRNSYYTTELHLTNQVAIPDVDGFTLRSGYRSPHLVVEAIFQNYTTLGGFDIRKNDNPFPSNRMNLNSLGMNIKYEFKKPLNGFTLYGGANYVLSGRNIGQMKTFDTGLFYAFYTQKHISH